MRPMRIAPSELEASEEIFRLSEQGKLVQAASYARQALGKWPKSHDLRFDLRDVLLEAGDSEGALTVQLELISLAPRCYGYYGGLGDIYLRCFNDPQRALEAYRQAQRLNRQDPLRMHMLFMIGLCWYKLGNRKRARAAWREAIKNRRSISWALSFADKARAALDATECGGALDDSAYDDIYAV